MEKDYGAALEKIEEGLKKSLPPKADGPWCSTVFPGLDLSPELAEALLRPGRELFNRGGKRWRPLLSLLVCRALGGGDSVLPLLPLVEFPHTASLIHDDLEDNSDERRGKPAIHLLFGNDTAINSGAFLYFLPLASLETWDERAENKNRIWQLWGEHMRRLHLGQSLDIQWHRDPAFVPSIPDYMRMCALKTGCLSRFAALLGAEAARITPGGISGAQGRVPAGPASSPAGPKKGPGPAVADSVGAAAEKLGVGFQILDDVKNLAAGVPGKKRGDDVVEGKKSLPVLLFLLEGRDGTGKAGDINKDRAEFTRRCFQAARTGGVSVPEVEEFTGALREAGALEEAERRGRALIGEAAEVFASLGGKNQRTGTLLAEFMERLQ
ncbi:MAG: polyprenyl synthetase family protein [Spirochaetaceae bacterium]|jgi:octaprenyl-diphosphate synthase|nr:polyprenyl synthetase family protein [Spirochaetaceae bacterium]